MEKWPVCSCLLFLFCEHHKLHSELVTGKALHRGSSSPAFWSLPLLSHFFDSTPWSTWKSTVPPLHPPSVAARQGLSSPRCPLRYPHDIFRAPWCSSFTVDGRSNQGARPRPTYNNFLDELGAKEPATLSASDTGRAVGRVSDRDHGWEPASSREATWMTKGCLWGSR